MNVFNVIQKYIYTNQQTTTTVPPDAVKTYIAVSLNE